MRTGVPRNENWFFPVRISTQGKPCSGSVLALYGIAVKIYVHTTYLNLLISIFQVEYVEINVQTMDKLANAIMKLLINTTGIFIAAAIHLVRKTTKEMSHVLQGRSSNFIRNAPNLARYNLRHGFQYHRLALSKKGVRMGDTFLKFA